MLGLAAVPRAGFVSPTTTTTLQAASKLPVKDWTTPLPLVIGPTEVTPSEIVKVASANAKSATATDAKAITTSFKLLMPFSFRRSLLLAYSAPLLVLGEPKLHLLVPREHEPAQTSRYIAPTCSL